MFGYKNGKAIDIEGIKSLDDIKNYYYDFDGIFELDFTEDEVRNTLCGDSDNKPLYNITEDDIQKALDIIRKNKEKYII